MATKQNKKTILLVLLVLLASGTAIAIYAMGIRKEPTSYIDKETGINYSPPTDEEKQQAEDNKKHLSEDTDKNSIDTSSNLKQVRPLVSSSGQYEHAQYGTTIEVRTIITEVYEDTGSCTATFTLNNQKLERKVEALKDVSTTRCDSIIIPRSEFPSAGIWDLVVNYTSPSAYGNSEVTKVEIR